MPNTTNKYPKRIKRGECLLCHRETDLTFHHLIPKKMHRRTYFKKHFDKLELASGIDICRQCHRGIHKAYDEMTLAKRFYSLSLIQADETLCSHFAWVGKQRVE